MEFDIWTQSLLSAMTTLWSKVAGFIPNVFGALVVILAGFAVAKIHDTVLSKVHAKLGLDRVLAGAAGHFEHQPGRRQLLGHHRRDRIAVAPGGGSVALHPSSRRTARSIASLSWIQRPCAFSRAHCTAAAATSRASIER